MAQERPRAAPPERRRRVAARPPGQCVASNGLAGRVVDAIEQCQPGDGRKQDRRAAAPSAGSAPTFTTRIGSTSAPTAADTVFSVISTPNARPRSSSGTSRWKTVVSTTSRTIEPAAVRPMASRAMPSTGNAPSAAAPTLTRKAHASSGRASAAPQDEDAGHDRPDQPADADRGVEEPVRLFTRIQHRHRGG